MSFLAFVMCQVETSESVEGIFPDGLKNHLKDSIGPLQLGSRDQNSPKNIISHGL